MEIAFYYTNFLPALLPFITGQGQLARLNDGRLSDKQIIDAVSNFFAEALAGIRPPQPNLTELPYMVEPVYTSAHIQIVSGASAGVQSFLRQQGIMASESIDELTIQLRDWYMQYASSIASIYRNNIISASPDATSIPITFPANIKGALMGFAKLLANNYITCNIPLEIPSEPLEWNNYINSITPISGYLSNKDVLDIDTLLQYNADTVLQQSYYTTRVKYAIESSDHSCLNMFMLKNKVTNRYIPIMAYLYVYDYGSNFTYPLTVDNEKLHLIIEDQGSAYGTYYRIIYAGSLAQLLSEGYTGPALSNPQIGILSFQRINANNGLATIDVSLPYQKITGFQSYLEPMGLVLPSFQIEENIYPSSTPTYYELFGRSIGNLTRELNPAFFGSMSDNDVINYANYEIIPYIYNNIKVGENYEFPVTIDPNIKSKLISDEYDIIGSGNSTDASARSDEGVTIVVDPASVGLLSDVYPLSDALADAVNVYPVDLANDKTITDNPAEAISIDDAAVAIDVANENSGVAIGVSPLELVSATGRYGMFTIYKVTISQLIALSSKLWSQDFLDNFHPFKNNPSEALISLMAYPMDINSSGSDSSIICGNFDCSPASGKVVSNLFNTKTLGSVNIPLTFNNFLDYSPYTTVNLFLPFIGFVELDVDEVMGANISVFYRVEVITGTCVAYVKVKKGTMDAILYQYAGNMGITLPLSGSDFSRVYSLLATASVGVLGSVLGAGALTMGAAAGFAGQAVASKPPVHKTGSLSGNSGMCGNLVPYVVVNTVIPDTPDGYKALKGKPTNKYLRIGDLQGFVQLDKFYLNIPNITDEEKIELDALLKDGIFV